MLPAWDLGRGTGGALRGGVGFLMIGVSNDWPALGASARRSPCAVPIFAVSIQHCCAVPAALLLPAHAQVRRGSRPLVCFVTQFHFTSAAYHVSLAYKSC